VNPLTHTSTLSIISAMITPAVLILASGSLVTSTLTRLARVTDRARVLIDRVRDFRASGESVQEARYAKLLKDYVYRTGLIERALSAYYLAIGLFVGASLTIAFGNVIDEVAPWLPTTLVVAGAVLLLVGSLAIFLETNMAAGILRRDIELLESGQH
jgi:ABC-type dipeptide/oligopeptide/nickel transport system permease component